MSAQRSKVRILVIRAWTEPLTALRAALHDAGIDARITRIDIEPALNAAVSRGDFDLILHDPDTPGVPREIVDATLREHRCRLPIVCLDDVESIAATVKRVLDESLN